MNQVERVFEALGQARVRYVVVGGLAVVLHGRARFTADLDLAIDLSEEQASRAVAALQNLGLRPRLPVKGRQFADPETRRRWVREKGMKVFTFWDPDRPLLAVDVFAGHPIDFETLWRDSVTKRLRGLCVRVASLRHLIELKRIAGRPQDLEDIRYLEEIRRKGGGNE